MVAPVYIIVCLVFNVAEVNALENISYSMMLNAMLLYPVFEEIIFRGFIQGELVKLKIPLRSMGPISCANLLASIIFSLAHIISLGHWSYLAVFFPSLIFGWAYESTKSLLLPIVLHAWFNAAGLLLLFGAQ